MARYTPAKTISLREAGLKWTGLQYGQYNWAEVETIKTPKKYYTVKMQYVCYSKFQNKLYITYDEQDDNLTLFTFITLHNRRILLEKNAGYDRYRREL